MSTEELQKQIDSLKALRSREGRGRGPEAQHVRKFVKEELRAIRAELRKRGETDPPTSVRNLGWNSVRVGGSE